MAGGLTSSIRSKAGRLGLGVLAAAVLVGVAVIAVSTLRSAGAGPGQAAVAEPLPVETFTARYVSEAAMEARYPGLVSPWRMSALGFETGGRIVAIDARIGDRVSEGDVLARLDTRTLEAQVSAARAEASAAEAQAGLARVTLERQQALVDRGHVSGQRLDESAASQRAALARAAAARASAEALAVRLELSTLTAPFDGVVTARHLDEGAIAPPGAPVLTLVEDSRLEMRVSIPASEAGRLEPGRAYPVEFGSQRAEARLRTVTGVIEMEQRAVTAVFDIDGGEGASSGAVGRVRVRATLQERGFWAPVTALTEGRRGLWSMYVLIADNGAYRIEPRPVEVIHTEGDTVFVRGAVNDGDTVMAAGVNRVAPGQRVRAEGGA
ncbi:efflux RND transporter periplasmic adaptor subunit [Alkalicaulis satelles]|uniref:Efflux RND transporter periplasmic adaptor subunit n=1 Tax=Alkalicaulis satelles TaxID=2609175 RepID=A0A5M6ZAD7_9PROT|nr:efflux RND transporter periplasmic adaptor subunit [Alkalicaulis satelles]KAA5801666.1 efflux RND transporter periplasmic adaptor subunit [Alkalicaulis satelles]